MPFGISLQLIPAFLRKKGKVAAGISMENQRVTRMKETDEALNEQTDGSVNNDGALNEPKDNFANDETKKFDKAGFFKLF